MALVSQRINLALQIGFLKADQNLPVKNFQVEKQVLERIENYAGEFELDSVFSKQLFQNIISQSVNAQVNARMYAKYENNGKSILILGGAGKMGSWLDQFFRSTGYNVSIVDPSVQNRDRYYTELPEDLDIFNYIFVSVPLEKTQGVLNELVKRNCHSVIFEIASLKSDIIETIRSAKDRGINLVSIHPMFGADVLDLSDRNLIVCTLGSEDEPVTLVKDIFGDTMVNIRTMPIEQHDQYILYSLGLSHLINLLNGHVLTKSGISSEEMEKISSTTYKNQKLTTEEVFAENPSLYFHIQQMNNHKEELFNHLRESLSEIESMVHGNNLESFVELMRTGSAFFDGGNDH